MGTVSRVKARDVGSAVTRSLAYLCHESRDPVYENNPWRSLVAAAGWALVAWSLTMPLLGVAIRRLPWPAPTHDVVGAVLGILLFVDLAVLVLVLGAMLVFVSRAIPRYPLTQRTADELPRV